MATPASVQSVVADPKFQSLGADDQLQVLQHVDANFAKLSQADQISVINHVSPAKQSGYEKFTDDVTKGLGFDAQKIRAANGDMGQAVEIGRQAATNLGRFAVSVLKDPFNVVKPLDAMATGVTTALGLPDKSSQSVFDPNSYSKPNLGQTVGALANVAGAIEAPGAPSDIASLAQGAGDVASKVNEAQKSGRNFVAQKIVEPLVDKTPTQARADLQSGIKPGQSIVDEGLVGGNKSLIKQADKRIGELSSQTDAALKNSPNANVTIDTEPIVDGAISAAQDAAKKSGNQAIVTRLDNLKDALKSQYGSLSGTPFDIQRLKQSIGEVASDLGSFKATDPLESSAAGALKDIYSRLNDAIASKVPKVSDFNDRVSKLIGDRDGLIRSSAKDSKSVLDSAGIGATFLKLLKKSVASAPVRSGVAKFISSQD